MDTLFLPQPPLLATMIVSGVNDSGISIIHQSSSSEAGHDLDDLSSRSPAQALPANECLSVPISRWEEEMEAMDVVYDGGCVAWMTVCGSWMVQFCTYGYTTAFGIYLDFYSRSFLSQQTPSTISWIGSFQLFFLYFGGVFVAKACNSGYFHFIIACGTVIQVVSMFLLSCIKPHHYYQVFLAQALGMGVGQSLLFLPSLTVVSHHFKYRRSLAIGIAVSGSSIGGIVWPILLNKLSLQMPFSSAIQVTAALCTALLLASNFLLKTQVPCHVSNTNPPVSFFVLFKDWAYLVSIISAFCINIGIFFPYFYIQLFTIDLGVEKRLAFYTVAIMNAGGFIGRLLPAFYAHQLGIYNLLLICLTLASALAFAMLSVKSFVGIVLFCLFYGFASGAYFALIPTLLTRFSNHAGEVGIRMGLAFAVVGISVLIGNPIEGSVLHVHDGGLIWPRSIFVCGSTLLCGTAGMALSYYLFTASKRGA